MTSPFLRFLGLAALLVSLHLPEPAAAQDAAQPVWIGFNEALAQGKATGKMVLVDVYSPRCGWCRKMQEETYTRPDLLAYVNEHFVTGRLNIDIRDDTVKYMDYDLSSAELSVGFGAQGTPTTVFLMPDGSYITRLPGFSDYDAFMPVLRFIGSESFRDMSFDEYMKKVQSGATGGR